jgi:exoribonuclease-2
LYKVRPARVVRVGEKIEIELDGGDTKRVRPKDLELLHPGPLRSLDELGPQKGETDEAWALLEGGETTLQELAELAFSSYTPGSRGGGLEGFPCAHGGGGAGTPGPAASY